MEKMRRPIFFLAFFVLVMGIVKFVYFPSDYQYGDWMEPFDGHLRKFDFAKYNLPDTYEMITYRYGRIDDKKLVAFRNKKSGQLLLLAMFREHPRVDLNKVTVDQGEAKRPFGRTELHPIVHDFFAIEYLLPFGARDDIENSGHDAILRKVQVEKKERWSTDKTEIFYIQGIFNRLGFYKRSDNWRHFVTPLFDFMGEMRGAIAVINDKKTKKTLFAIGCREVDKKFDEAEFRAIIRSLNFDATPLPEAFSGIPGWKRSTTVTTRL